jgi:hypothetical protein
MRKFLASQLYDLYDLIYLPGVLMDIDGDGKMCCRAKRRHFVFDAGIRKIGLYLRTTNYPN